MLFGRKTCHNVAQMWHFSTTYILSPFVYNIPTSASHVPPNEPVLLSCHLYAACHTAIDRLLHCFSPELSDTERPSLISLAVTATFYMAGSQPFVYKCAPRGTRTGSWFFSSLLISHDLCNRSRGDTWVSWSQPCDSSKTEANQGPVPWPFTINWNEFDTLTLWHL